MKKRILLYLSLFLLSNTAFAQLFLKNDSFKFRNDVMVDYNLFVKNNDSNGNTLKIKDLLKYGSSASQYTLTISADSNYININSTDINLTSGEFRYTVINSSLIEDTAHVVFDNVLIAPSVYPGDCNNDNLVNHFDLFPIGMTYHNAGNPRHNSDTGVSFSPKRAQNWFFNAGTINGKFADIDGNGSVDTIDYIKLKNLVGQSRGNYLPVLSSGSSSVSLKLSVSDTVKLYKDTGRIVANVIVESPIPLSSYGLGFSYTVRVFNKSTSLDSFYPNQRYYRTNVWNDLSNLYIEDNVSLVEHTNVAYCRTSKSNGGMDGTAGIIEIVTDEVLLGLANPGDKTYVNILLKEVALIDDKYNTIPISPISKRIYFQKSVLSIQSANELNFKAYPTHVNHHLTIEKNNAKPESYTIYNSVGQIIMQGVLKQTQTVIDNINWNTGLYFIKLDNSSEVIKLQKM